LAPHRVDGFAAIPNRRANWQRLTDIEEPMGYDPEAPSLNCREAEALQAKLDQCEEALHQIDSWSRAYPLRIFPEPDLKRVRELLEAGGITLDSVSASCMRHCVEGVGKIARAALNRS
jgi:hypothetical protein